MDNDQRKLDIETLKKMQSNQDRVDAMMKHMSKAIAGFGIAVVQATKIIRSIENKHKRGNH